MSRYKATILFEGEDIAEDFLVNDVTFAEGWLLLIYGEASLEAYPARSVQHVKLSEAEVSKLEMP